MAVDELQNLALIRAREQARALLMTLRDAMVEVDRPSRLALACLLADGHLLIEDVPGTGKTTLARIMARAMGGHDGRIQCSADLTASAVIGVLRDPPAGGLTVRQPEFDPGPIFANAVVFDEINRATPQLQSALLEAMEEKVVTVGKHRHPLPRPFYVIATMNPHDSEGTFELPHAQRDRFAMRTSLGYASERGELDMIGRFAAFDVIAEIDPIVAPGDIVKLQRAVSLVDVSGAVREYLVRLLRATREHPDVLVGASPRAMLSMFRCIQATALVDSMTAAAPRHVSDLFEPCIAHRLRFRPGTDEAAVVSEILESVGKARRARAARGDDRRRPGLRVRSALRGLTLGAGDLAQPLEDDGVEPGVADPALLEVLGADPGAHGCLQPVRSRRRRVTDPAEQVAQLGLAASVTSSCGFLVRRRAEQQVVDPGRPRSSSTGSGWSSTRRSTLTSLKPP